MAKEINARIQLKHDSSSNWSKATNFKPRLGEPIYYTDKNYLKLGDGETSPANLPYVGAWAPGTGKDSLVQQGSNAQAINEKAYAIGRDTIAGCKGFYVSAIYTGDEQNPPRLRLTTTQPAGLRITNNIIYADSSLGLTEGYKAGQEFNVICGNHYVSLGKITWESDRIVAFDGDIDRLINGLHESVKANVATITEATDGFTFKLNADAVGSDDYTFFVPAAPNIGVIECGTGASASGRNTIAAGVFSNSRGRDTIALEGYADVSGRGSQAGYIAHAQNYKTKALGHYSDASGEETEARGIASRSGGHHAIADGFASVSEGIYTETKEDGQIAQGFYNKVNEGSVYMLGDGSSVEGGRHNLFELRKFNGVRSMLLGDVEVSEDLLKTMTMSVPRYTLDGEPIDPDKQYIAMYIQGMWMAVEMDDSAYQPKCSLRLYDKGGTIKTYPITVGETWNQFIARINDNFFDNWQIDTQTGRVKVTYEKIDFWVVNIDAKYMMEEDVILPITYKFLCVEHKNNYSIVTKVATTEETGLREIYCSQCGKFHSYGELGKKSADGASLFLSHNGTILMQWSYGNKTTSIPISSLDPNNYYMEPPILSGTTADGRSYSSVGALGAYKDITDPNNPVTYRYWKSPDGAASNIVGGSILMDRDRTLTGDWGFGFTLFPNLPGYTKAVMYRVNTAGSDAAWNTSKTAYLETLTIPDGWERVGYRDRATGTEYRWDDGSINNKVFMNGNKEFDMIWKNTLATTSTVAFMDYNSSLAVPQHTLTLSLPATITIPSADELGLTMFSGIAHWSDISGNKYQVGQTYTITSDMIDPVTNTLYLYPGKVAKLRYYDQDHNLLETVTLDTMPYTTTVKNLIDYSATLNIISDCWLGIGYAEYKCGSTITVSEDIELIAPSCITLQDIDETFTYRLNRFKGETYTLPTPASLGFAGSNWSTTKYGSVTHTPGQTVTAPITLYSVN